MIKYKSGVEVINWDSLMDLYCETDGVIGLARANKLPKIKSAFMNTYKVVTAWENDKIVGAGRMISDGECYGWIHDIAVHPNYRKMDIGKNVMNELMKDDQNLLIGLTSSFEAVEFYDKLGFKKHKTAMAKYPGKSSYLMD